MSPISRDQLKSYCDDLNVMARANRDDDQELIAGLETPVGLARLTIRVRDDGVILMSVPGLFLIPEGRRPNACQMMADMHYRAVTLGRFCMDGTDGELAFEVGIATANTGLSCEAFSQVLVGIAFVLVDLLPKLLQFVKSDASFSDFLRVAKGDPMDELRSALQSTDDEAHAS